MDSLHRKGLALVAISALLYSTPGLFTRGVAAGGWEVIFWRGIFGVAFASLYLMWRGTWRKDVLGMKVPAWTNAIIWASGAIAYLHAFKLTSIANVSLIYGSAPIMTALIAWFLLKERPRTIVIAASLLAFAGVVVIAGGSLGSINLNGDLLALWMTFSTAIAFPLYRKYPETSAAGTALWASALPVPIALIWAQPLTVSTFDLMLLAIFAFVFIVASIMLTEGSKILPSGETALLSNLEVPLQPLLAWFIFTELPPRATFIGGALVLLAVGVSSWPSRTKV